MFYNWDISQKYQFLWEIFASCDGLDFALQSRDVCYPSIDGFPCKYLFPSCRILRRTGQNISFFKITSFWTKAFPRSLSPQLSFVTLHISSLKSRLTTKGVVQQRGRLNTHKEEERASKVFKVFKVFKVSHTTCQGGDEDNEEDWGEDWGGGGDLRLEHVSPVDNWKIKKNDKLWTNRKVMIAPGTGVVTSWHWGALPFHRFPSIHASGSGLQKDLLTQLFCIEYSVHVFFLMKSTVSLDLLRCLRDIKRDIPGQYVVERA